MPRFFMLSILRYIRDPMQPRRAAPCGRAAKPSAGRGGRKPDIRLASLKGVRTALLLVLLSAALPARANFDEPYVAAKLTLGSLGEADFEGEVDILSSASIRASSEERIDFTLGGALGFAYPVFELLTLGGQLAVGSWSSNFYVDLALVPQLRLKLSAGELYAAMPVGPSLDFADDTSINRVGPLADRDASVGTGFGFHAGLNVGLRAPVSDDIGLLVELGVLAHRFNHSVEVPASRFVPFAPPDGSAPTPTPAQSTDITVTLLQGVASFGAYY